MAGFTQLSPDLFVSGQITAADLEAAAHLGIRSVINNRPDGEEQTQPPAALLQGACQRLGLAYRHVPLVSRLKGREWLAKPTLSLKPLGTAPGTTKSTAQPAQAP